MVNRLDTENLKDNGVINVMVESETFVLYQHFKNNGMDSKYILNSESDEELVVIGKDLKDLASKCFWEGIRFRQCDDITTIPAPIKSLGFGSGRKPVSLDILEKFRQEYLEVVDRI